MTEPSSAARVRPVNGPVGGTPNSDDPDGKLRDLAGILSRKIKIGQRKREEREVKQGYAAPNDYTYPIFQCMQQATDKSFEDYLDRVEHALAVEVQESTMKRRAWTAWFVLSCLQLIRDKRRGGRKRLPARGAKLANLIVNHLLVSDGAAALGVYDALAGEECIFSSARTADGFQSNATNCVRHLSAPLRTSTAWVAWCPRSSVVRFMYLLTIPGYRCLGSC